ncbi:MAG TPA: electron transfer flavoprotein subunit beta/FixA family protein [Planctomycetota bacterium]|nr:electron transfer flavoprotein subunit beta/FixA family protein [Planctomycetota bacterium]
MNLYVCLSRVPDTATRIRVHADGLRIDPEGVQFTINPFDEFAVEEAVKLKEKQGGKVTVITVGPAEAQKDLRACLARGVDDAVLLAPKGPVDGLGVAKLLAARLKDAKPDAIFCGKQSVDDDQGAVGPMLAALLGMPVVTRVVKFEARGATFAAAREIEGGLENVEGAFPAVITADKGLNKPRAAGLKDIMGAKNKPLVQESVDAPAPKLRTLKLEPPAERAPGRIVGEGKAATAKLVDALRNESKVL